MRSMLGLLCVLAGCGGPGIDGDGGPDGGDGDGGGGGDGSVDYGGEVLAFASPLGLALDDDRVYWASWLGGSVDAVDKQGGEPVEVVPELVGPAALVRVGDRLFVTSENDDLPDDMLWRGSTGGGAGVVVEDGVRRERLVADGDAVYYLDGDYTLKRVIGDAAPVAIAAPVQFDFLDVVDGVVLFDRGGELQAYDVVGGTTTPLTTFTGEIVGATVHDGESLVVTASDAGTLALSRVPLTGGAPSEIWSGPGGAYGGIELVIDGGDVYLPIIDVPISGYGAIVRISISTGTSQVIASNQPAPAAIALDATHIYWADRGVGGDVTNENRRGRVMRKAR